MYNKHINMYSNYIYIVYHTNVGSGTMDEYSCNVCLYPLIYRSIYLRKCVSSRSSIHLLSSIDLFLCLIKYCVMLRLLRCIIRLSSIHSSLIRALVLMVTLLSLCIVSVVSVLLGVLSSLLCNSSRNIIQSYVSYSPFCIVVLCLYGRRYCICTTSCIPISLCCKSSLYETSPIRLSTLYGPLYTSRTFLQFLNCGKCFVDNNT